MSCLYITGTYTVCSQNGHHHTKQGGVSRPLVDSLGTHRQDRVSLRRLDWVPSSDAPENKVENMQH